MVNSLQDLAGIIGFVTALIYLATIILININKDKKEKGNATKQN